MYKYLIWIPIGALSGSYTYLFFKRHYNNANNKYGHRIRSINDIIFNDGFFLGGLLGYTYVCLNNL